jgi:hypothetical protein
MAYVQQAPLEMLPSVTRSAIAGADVSAPSNLASEYKADMAKIWAELKALQITLKKDIVSDMTPPPSAAETVGTEARLAISDSPPQETPTTLVTDPEIPVDKLAQWVRRKTANVIHLDGSKPNTTDRVATVCGWKFAYATCEYEFLNELSENHEFRSCLRCLPELRGMDGSLVGSESSDSE